jgi:hypothetical protein
VRRVFIGYAAWRPGVEPRVGHLREAIVDLRCPDEEWAAVYPRGKERRQFQQNRNFIRAVERGAIALVPRPDRGVVYAGRVVEPFELFDDPPWGNDYLQLRRDQGKKTDDDVLSHISDVANCCEVDEFREIPFPFVPAWIR